MITGIVMALGFWIVVIQLPFKEIWTSRIWIMDLITTLLFVQILFSVRSTEIAIASTWAAVSFTILVHIWAKIYRKVHRI